MGQATRAAEQVTSQLSIRRPLAAGLSRFVIMKGQQTGLVCKKENGGTTGELPERQEMTDHALWAALDHTQDRSRRVQAKLEDEQAENDGMLR